jgi:ribonuclease P protein component
VLAAINRLTSREDFARVTRSPIRSTTQTLVGYLTNEPALTTPKIGFVVSRAIGGSVTRHRVTRQLRHASKNALHILPQSSMVVVRATNKEQNPHHEIPELFTSLNKKASR